MTELLVQHITSLKTKAGNYFYRNSVAMISSTGELLINGHNKSSLDVKIRFHSGEKLVLRFYDEAAKLVTNKGLGKFPNTDEMNFAAVLGRFLGKVDIQKEDLITFEKFIEEFEEKEKPQKGFDDMDTIEQYLLGRIHVEEEELLTWLPGLIPTKKSE